MTVRSERAIAQSGSGVVPRAVGLDINAYVRPDLPLAGKAIRLNLRDGFDVSAYDLRPTAAMELDTESEPCMAINVMLAGAGSGRIALARDVGATGEVLYADNTTYACVMRSGLRSHMSVPAGARAAGVDIRLTFDFLERQKALPDVRYLGPLHPWHHCSGADYWIGFSRSARSVAKNAESILQEVFSAAPNDLLVEAKVLEIVSDTFSRLVAEGTRGNAISRKHSRLLARATYCSTISRDLGR